MEYKGFVIFYSKWKRPVASVKNSTELLENLISCVNVVGTVNLL